MVETAFSGFALHLFSQAGIVPDRRWKFQDQSDCSGTEPRRGHDLQKEAFFKKVDPEYRKTKSERR
jgi:hypothetical protein